MLPPDSGRAMRAIRLLDAAERYGLDREQLRSRAGIQLAPTLLGDQTLAVFEVAYLLGYADQSAFFRAFRRWHGFSPARYRRLDLLEEYER